MSTTPTDNRKDFIYGFIGFFALNLILFLILAALVSALNVLPKGGRAEDIGNNAFAFALFCLPILANIGALIYFLFKRRAVALGGIVGLIVVCVCATIGFALLINSGFSLV